MLERIDRILSDHKFHLLVLFVLASLILFSHLHEGGLSGYDDALYAHEGKQMLITGDWWNVRFNGYPNFEYPPMFIWLEALSMKVLGISDFAAKFPSALSALLTIVLVFYLTRELGGGKVLAISASWILMLSQYFIKYAMHAMTDAPFTFFMTLSLYWYLKGLKNRNYLILCGLAIGAGIMTRSVIGLIPVAIMAGHLMVTRQALQFRSIRLVVGLSIALLLPCCWYFSQYSLHGEPFLSRHLSFIGGKVHNGGEWDPRLFVFGLLQYPGLLLKLYWPWLPFMLFGLALQFKRAIHRESAALMLIIWVFLVVVPFSLAEAKVLRYIMPAFPAFAILAAAPVVRLISLIRRPVFLRAAYAALIAAVLFISCFPTPMRRAEDLIALAPKVDARATPSQRVIFYTDGPARFDRVAQFLWYSNRFCAHLVEPGELAEALKAKRSQLFIMAVEDYEQLVANSGVEVEMIIRTKNLVCFSTSVVDRTMRLEHEQSNADRDESETE